MENLKITTKNILCLATLALVASCKAPMATVIQDQVKTDLPAQFEKEANTENTQNSGITPWRQFFTDSDLTNLIEIALKNNQELLITLQKIEIAKVPRGKGPSRCTCPRADSRPKTTRSASPLGPPHSSGLPRRSDGTPGMYLGVKIIIYFKLMTSFQRER